jgi:hypothetical protein
VLTEPLSNVDAERLSKAVIRTGIVSFGEHARSEMAKDKLIVRDVENILPLDTAKALTTRRAPGATG